MPKKSKSLVFLPPLTLLSLVIVSIIVFWLFSPKKINNNSATKQQEQQDQQATKQYQESDLISLPAPSKTGRISLEQTLNSRRSRRSFFDRAISLKQLSQILWAAQGVTADWGGRTAPSAKDAYPLSLYIIAIKVDGLQPGVYQYLPGETTPVHKLGLIQTGNFAEKTAEAGKQSQFKQPAAALIITGNMQKMTDAFDGKANDNNVYLEAGHAAQNIYLQVESLGLGTVTTGGFDRAKTAELLQNPSSETFIYMMPLGYPEE